MPSHDDVPRPEPASGDPAQVDDFIRYGLTQAVRVARSAPVPGGGDTLGLWRILAELGRTDLALARIVEPHLDAVAILTQAGREDLLGSGTTWGVWAAEGGTDPLRAVPVGGGWQLTGTKPWCSLAHHVSHAVVTAHVCDRAGEPTGRRRAFAIGTDGGGFRPHPAGTWIASGLSDVTTVPVDFHEVRADPVGQDEWYLTRPGFAWGGMGVAAVWWGGAAAVADALWRRSVSPSRPLDEIAPMHLGRVDATLHAGWALLERAARAVDDGEARGQDGAVWALRTRRAVSEAAEEVLREVSQATGPGPLTGDAQHIRTTQALQVYIRQEHGQRDARALGQALLERSSTDRGPW